MDVKEQYAGRCYHHNSHEGVEFHIMLKSKLSPELE